MIMKKTVKTDDKRRKNIVPDNLADNKKEQVRNDDKNRKKDKHSVIIDERSSLFDIMLKCVMIGAFSLTTPAFRLIEDFKSVIQEFPTYICHICYMFHFPKNAIKLKGLEVSN